jgi:hypothetical protein
MLVLEHESKLHIEQKGVCCTYIVSGRIVAAIKNTCVVEIPDLRCVRGGDFKQHKFQVFGRDMSEILWHGSRSGATAADQLVSGAIDCGMALA